MDASVINYVSTGPRALFSTFDHRYGFRATDSCSPCTTATEITLSRAAILARRERVVIGGGIVLDLGPDPAEDARRTRYLYRRPV